MKMQNNTKRVHTKHNASKKGYKHAVRLSYVLRKRAVTE